MQKILKDGAEVLLIGWRYVVWLSISLLLFFVAFSTADDLADHVRHTPLLGVAIFLIFLVIAVAAHELGHALAAWAFGYHVHLIVVGPIGYRPAAKRFQYVFRSDSGDFGGYMFATPPVNRSWKRGWASVVAGGPVSSLLFAGILFFLTAVLEGHGNSVAGGLAMTSLIVGISSLVPVTEPEDKSRSDGAYLLAIARGLDVSEEAKRSALLTGLRLDGADPVQWDADILAYIESGPVRPQDDLLRDHMLLRRHFTVGDIKKAKALLDQSDAARRGSDLGLAIEYAYLLALLDEDTERSANLLSKVPQAVREKTFNFWRAQAVVDAVRGDRIAALLSVGNARRIVQEERCSLDDDDGALFAAIERDQPLPREWRSMAAA